MREEQLQKKDKLPLDFSNWRSNPEELYKASKSE
jgi:hypothetical protein